MCFCSRCLFLSLDPVPLNSLIHLWIRYILLTLKYKSSQHSEDLRSQLERFSWTFLQQQQQQQTVFLSLNSRSPLLWFPKHLTLWFLTSVTGTPPQGSPREGFSHRWQGPLPRAVPERPPCSFPSHIVTTPDPHSRGSKKFYPLNSLSYFFFSLSTFIFPTLATCLDSQAGIEILLERFPVVPWN